MGSADVAAHAAAAHRHLPELRRFDRYGNRIDEVEYHPSYHRMMQIGIEAGISAAPWCGVAGGHALHAALEKLLTPTRGLLIDAARLTRVDAAALQILIAASRSAAAITVIARSDAWDSACQRYALAAGFPRKANSRH